ncbi:MAG: LOG family protein [Alphaproteobacteria bacterium]|nr:LOG family protein [Alphaproteobacteria bacterium]
MEKSKSIEAFAEQNSAEGLRVFVAGGARSGNDEIYVDEAYNLGRQIVKMKLRLDFGLSNSGIMGAVARGVVDEWNKIYCNSDLKSPIQGITTNDYFCLYPHDDKLLNQISDIFVAKTLEERKQKLLKADFVVFAPGGVGTLDELAYDCVAMQDGFLNLKPFILYNIDGFFYHLLEYLKQISAKGFAEPLPFIVVDNSLELEVVFRLLKLHYVESQDKKIAYGNTRELIYELPYFLKKKTDSHIHVEDIIAEMEKIRECGSEEEKQELAGEIEQAYLEKEIERMYERLAKTGRDTSVVSDKLTRLKQRRIKQK